MSQTRRNLHSLLLVASCLCLFCAAHGKTASKPRGLFEPDEQLACKVGDLSFKCPSGYKIIQAGPNDTYLYLFNKQNKHGVFVTALPATNDEQHLVADIIKSATNKLLPKEPQTFEWHQQGQPQKISKYEISAGDFKGFNRRVLVSARYRRLSFNGKNFLVGYVTEVERGKDAAEMFDRSSTLESMSGCEATVTIIYSVTGEKINEENPPCSLSIIAPANN